MDDIVAFGKQVFRVIGVKKLIMFRPVRLAKFTDSRLLASFALINYKLPSCCVYNGMAALYVYSDACRALVYKKQTKQAAGAYRSPA